jgi:hypothetical protein
MHESPILYIFGMEIFETNLSEDIDSRRDIEGGLVSLSFGL